MTASETGREPTRATQSSHSFLASFRLADGQVIRAGRNGHDLSLELSIQSVVIEKAAELRGRTGAGYLVLSGTTTFTGGVVPEELLTRFASGVADKLDECLLTHSRQVTQFEHDLGQAKIVMEWLPEGGVLTPESEIGQTPDGMKSSPATSHPTTGQVNTNQPDPFAGASMPALPKAWSSNLWHYEPAGMRFSTLAELHSAIGLLLSPELQGMPHVTPGRRTLVIPKVALPVFRAAGHKFVEESVTKRGS